MATWGRCWRKSKICSSVFLADPWHQRDDRPVLRWVSPTSAPGARRRLPWCLCCSPWKPDRGIKQDHRKGWSFVAHAYRWLFYLWGNNEITLLNERNANSRGCIPQTLNMTNRWKKTSEDVQAISAPKVNPKYCLSSFSNKNFFFPGPLLLPLLHHHPRLCTDHQAQLPPAPNEGSRKCKFQDQTQLNLNPVMNLTILSKYERQFNPIWGQSKCNRCPFHANIQTNSRSADFHNTLLS